MRPADDLALRTRNWFWYRLVRVISGSSNAQLDAKAFGKDTRLGHFERIGQSGSDPSDRALQDGQTLLQIVDDWDRPRPGEPGPFSLAKVAFESRLWHFLSCPNLTLRDYADYAQSSIESRGWFRASTADVPPIVTFLGALEPAIALGDTPAYRAALHKICEEASLDGLALLIALFREALQARHLEQAAMLQRAIRGTTEFVCKCYGVDSQLKTLLHQLIFDRAIHDVWLSKADWHVASGASKGKLSTRGRIREIQHWVAWYINRSRDRTRKSYSQFPIVPRSARIDWLFANLADLEKAYALNDHHQKRRSSSSRSERAVSPSRSLRRESTTLEHMMAPPLANAEFVCDPQIELMFLMGDRLFADD